MGNNEIQEVDATGGVRVDRPVRRWDLVTISHFLKVLCENGIPAPIGISIPAKDWDELCERFGEMGKQLKVSGLEIYKGTFEEAWDDEFSV